MTKAGLLGRDDGDECPADHRQLFSRLNDNQPEDSSTDQDEYSDDGLAKRRSKSDPAKLDDLVGVGVSIGRAQTKMKSLQTPAVEKHRVLIEHDNDYASFSALTQDQEGEAPLNTTPPVPVHETQVSDHGLVEHDTSIIQAPQQLPLPLKADLLPYQRSSASRPVLGGISAARERSSSGSMLTGFKKVLQDLPSITTLKGIPSPFASAKPENAAGQRDHNLNASSFSLTVQQPSEMESALESPARGGNVEPLPRPITPVSTHSRHRANSDSSLYLSRRPTGVSSYDDTTTYATVSEMTNSRLKAITDALQNSSLRLPKLPSVMASLRTTENYEANVAADLTRDSPHANAQQSRDEQSQSTSLRSIRIAMNKQPTQHVQTPQQRAHPILAEALSHTEGDIVVLGGYRGSVLRDAKPPHRQLWAPIKLGFNLRSVDLEVGLTREDEVRAPEKVIPSGVLSHIGPIDICRRLLKHLKKCPNTREGRLRVHDWGYDWRLSPDLLSQQLIAFLQGLDCNNNKSNTPSQKRGAFVIAHSLGGLITRHAVNQRPDLFAGVVYAGVPQHCVNILGPLRNGDDVLLSSRVLTAQVNFTMRTSFALLPEGGRCFFQRDTNERYDIDFFDPKTWEEYRLSPCISPALPVEPWWQQHRKSIMDSMGSFSESMTAALPSIQAVGKRGSWFGGPIRDDGSQNHNHRDTGEGLSDIFSRINPAETTPATTEATSTTITTTKPSTTTTTISSSSSSSIATTVTIPPAAARAYLKRTLAEVLAFKRALAHREDLQKANKYPPHAILFGRTVPTVYGARVASKAAIQYSDAFDDLTFAAGDGVVLASAAQLPDGYRCVKGGRIETDRGHVGLLGDLEAVGRCIAAVVEARNRGVGNGNFQ
ncbi:hypothetical protein DV736_g4009, partial [Chaetothyriales sp. CBS 134916]